MASTNKTLVARKHLEATDTAQYTASGVRAIIDHAVIVNTGETNVSFSASIVKSSGTPADSNKIISSKILTPDQSYECPELVGQVLENGDFLSTIAAVSGVLSFGMSGREITS